MQSNMQCLFILHIYRSTSNYGINKQFHSIFIIFYSQQLRLKYPQYTFLPCFAHQCNLAVGEIFKESNILAKVSTDAVKLFLYFTQPNNAYFIGKLRNIQMELYHKYYAIIKPGDTRWNSYYDCYKSLI